MIVRPSRFRSSRTPSLVLQLGIQGAGDLVAKQSARLHRQRAGNGDALLLPAGELLRVGVHVPAHADALEELLGARARRRRRDAEHPRRSFHDVAEDVEVRKELEILKDHAERAANLIDLAAVIAGQEAVRANADFAGLERIESVEAAQQRRFAAA